MEKEPLHFPLFIDIAYTLLPHTLRVAGKITLITRRNYNKDHHNPSIYSLFLFHCGVVRGLYKDFPSSCRLFFMSRKKSEEEKKVNYVII